MIKVLLITTSPSFRTVIALVALVALGIRLIFMAFSFTLNNPLLMVIFVVLVEVLFCFLTLLLFIFTIVNNHL